MMVAPPSTVEQKRDLHVGGVGTRTGGALAAITHPIDRDARNPATEWTVNSLNDAASAVRENPWAAIAIVAALSLATGYMLGRRQE